VSSRIRETVERDESGSSKRLLQHRLDVARREPAQERSDHQRLERVGPGHVLAQHPALEPQLRRVAQPRALELDRARRRPDLARLVAVAMRHRLPGTLVAATAEEVSHLVLERLLQDQPGSQTTNRFHRILLLADTDQRLIKL
jgi:hypothetical protein